MAASLEHPGLTEEEGSTAYRLATTSREPEEIHFRSLLRLAILLLLRDEEGHGYELMGRLDELGVGVSPTTGWLYRSLRHLAEEGLVTSCWSTRNGARAGGSTSSPRRASSIWSDPCPPSTACCGPCEVWSTATATGRSPDTELADHASLGVGLPVLEDEAGETVTSSLEVYREEGLLARRRVGDGGQLADETVLAALDLLLNGGKVLRQWDESHAVLGVAHVGDREEDSAPGYPLLLEIEAVLVHGDVNEGRRRRQRRGPRGARGAKGDDQRQCCETRSQR